MKDLSPQEVEHLCREMRATASSSESLFLFLQASEYLVIEAMIAARIWTSPPPTDPGGHGELEWGLLPWWIHNPPASIRKEIDAHPWLESVWKTLELLVPTQMNAAEYANLKEAVKGAGIVGPDGTLISEEKYAALDAEWLWAAFDYLLSTTFKDIASFSKTGATVALGGSTVKVALVGDWGTGDATADAVMSRVRGESPDVIVHLGDVYYAGTGGLFFPLDEEKENFLGHWPTAGELGACLSFALNSNHEMYSGAKGLFGDVLDLGTGDARFARQGGSSYFALTAGGWTILGLDSAYYSKATLYMAGGLGGGRHDEQRRFVGGLGLDPAKTILLTHHNGLAYDGKTVEPFWDEVRGVLGGDPAAWYWGHVHNGIVYRTPTAGGSATLARCIGHGAIPFGAASGCASNDRVAWHADTPAGPGTRRVLNGFALLTIDTATGSVTEEIVQQDGSRPWTLEYGYAGCPAG